jgi:hypothetical protein
LLQNASLFLVQFPFGFLPGLGNIVVAPILNGILWSTIAGVIYVRLVRRQTA